MGVSPMRQNHLQMVQLFQNPPVNYPAPHNEFLSLLFLAQKSEIWRDRRFPECRSRAGACNNSRVMESGALA